MRRNIFVPAILRLTGRVVKIVRFLQKYNQKIENWSLDNNSTKFSTIIEIFLS